MNAPPPAASFRLAAAAEAAAILAALLAIAAVEAAGFAAETPARGAFAYWAALPGGIVDKAAEAAASSSALGEARLVGMSYDPRQEDALAGPLAPEPDSVALFAKASRFPALPAGFRLADYNVLLVTSEATRYDQTSLSDPALGTTPNLAALADDRGAYSFDRAFAASSGTLHAISGLLCMTFPSMARLETWGKAWHGELDAAEETVPELFARAGYDTFLASHDHNGALQKTMIGLGAGFASRSYVYESGDGPDCLGTDVRVAQAAIAEIRARPRGDRRFFGWVFFASPHADYLEHYADMPDDSDLELYRQELRFMDEQLGLVLAALRETGLLERTIVAFVGDHGEEFGEHGGEFHKSTVYSESTWVPLVVRVPGLGGGRIGAPTSVAYLFPWLALAGPPPLAEAARTRLSEEIGPMMRATDGAVIVELVGHDRMLSSLVYESRKINYDFISGRTEVFDTRIDPLEQRNLLLSRPELEAGARAAVEAYRRVRAAKRRYTLDPEDER
jgi:arylsulfatase A-like enzyme